MFCVGPYLFYILRTVVHIIIVCCVRDYATTLFIYVCTDAMKPFKLLPQEQIYQERCIILKLDNKRKLRYSYFYPLTPKPKVLTFGVHKRSIYCTQTLMST